MNLNRNENGVIIFSDYIPNILEFLRINGPSRYRNIIEYIEKIIGDFFEPVDLERSNHNWIVWKHQISEALFYLKKQGLIELLLNRQYKLRI